MGFITEEMLNAIQLKVNMRRKKQNNSKDYLRQYKKEIISIKKRKLNYENQ
tara:strand:+ start:140 stop:292 length:153 start_codon:yes stop_codon:yes gene_type:complete